MSFKEDPAGIVRFENIDFGKIIMASRNQLTRLAKLGKVEIGSGCIKYRFQTDLRTLSIEKGNASLVIELCQTFTNYFTASNGLNLGFEVVDRSNAELSFFYFTDEDISEEIFLDRLAKTEQNLWNLISTKPNLQLFGEEAATGKAVPNDKQNALVNAIDAISAIFGTLARASVRLVCGTWTRSDTKALLSAIRFNDDDAVEERAESLHQVILRNYTLVALANINAQQHVGLLPMNVTPHIILFLGANPSNTTRLALQREAQEIDTRLRAADLRDVFRVEQQWEVQADQLPGKIMRFKPQILHFSGHGDSSGDLVFQDQHGLASPAKQDTIAHVFSLIGSGIRCVVLNACFSSEQAEMIATHIDVVVGMSHAIGDNDAIKFAGAFYEALAFGKDVHTAFELAKLSIDLAHLPDGAVPQIRCRAGIDPTKLILAT